MQEADFTSLTAVVGGKGSVKGANMMKGNIFKGGFKNIIKNPKSLGKIMKADFKKFIKKAAATGKNVKKNDTKPCSEFAVMSSGKIRAVFSFGYEDFVFP